MDKEKLKKYLTGVKKMSESEADQEMARLSLEEKKEELSKLSAECDEHEKRLAAESDEKEKKEKEEAEGKDKEAKLSAARGKITQLKSGFTTLAEGARLAARSGKILTRLSALRAEAKITPAEIKKLDLKKLATESDASLELMLKSYKDREPVIHVGQLGSIRATNLASVQTSSRLSKLEAETRANMSLLSNSKDAAPDVRLSSAPHMSAAAELAPTPEEAAAVETEYNELVRLMDGGMVPAAKDRLKAFLVKATRLGGYAGGDYVESNSAETEREIAALSETVTKMQAQFEELASVASAALS
jgi:chromosome segregation ATPase